MGMNGHDLSRFRFYYKIILLVAPPKHRNNMEERNNHPCAGDDAPPTPIPAPVLPESLQAADASELAEPKRPGAYCIGPYRPLRA